MTGLHKRIEYEVGIIAHSCGLFEPRQLRRFHCRVAQYDGRSIPLDEIYSDQIPADSAVVEPALAGSASA